MERPAIGRIELVPEIPERPVCLEVGQMIAPFFVAGISLSRLGAGLAQHVDRIDPRHRPKPLREIREPQVFVHFPEPVRGHFGHVPGPFLVLHQPGLRVGDLAGHVVEGAAHPAQFVTAREPTARRQVTTGKFIGRLEQPGQTPANDEVGRQPKQHRQGADEQGRVHGLVEDMPAGRRLGPADIALDEQEAGCGRPRRIALGPQSYTGVAEEGPAIRRQDHLAVAAFSGLPGGGGVVGCIDLRDGAAKPRRARGRDNRIVCIQHENDLVFRIGPGVRNLPPCPVRIAPSVQVLQGAPKVAQGIGRQAVRLILHLPLHLGHAVEQGEGNHESGESDQENRNGGPEGHGNERYHGRAASRREARSKVSVNGSCPAVMGFRPGAIRAAASPANDSRFLERKIAETGLNVIAMSLAGC